MGRLNRLDSRTAIPQLEQMISEATAKVDELNNLLVDLDKLKAEIATKQPELISGKNIKTVNNNSLLGSGNIDIQGGGGGGTSDHSQLSNRGLLNQHPITAITNLPTVLNNLQTALNNKSNVGHTHEQYITEEEDPTVPDWAKEPTKPTYTAEEVGALPDDTVIPTKTSELINDSGFVTEGNTKVIYDVTGVTYDDISDYLYVYEDIVVEFNGVRYRFYHKDTDMHYFTSATEFGVAYVTLDITNRWRVTSVITPTKTSELTNDSGFITDISGKQDVITDLASIRSKAENGQVAYETIENDLSDVAFTGDYNDLTNQPTIPSETTVEQVLTSGTEIAKVNGTSLFAPQGGGGETIVEQVITSGTEIARVNGTSLFAPEETHPSFSMQTHTKTGITINSGAMGEGTFNATLAGYYPYGVVGFLLGNGSGSGSSYAIFNNMRITSRTTGSCTVNWRIRAYGGKITTCTLYVDILWIKA